MAPTRQSRSVVLMGGMSKFKPFAVLLVALGLLLTACQSVPTTGTVVGRSTAPLHYNYEYKHYRCGQSTCTKQVRVLEPATWYLTVRPPGKKKAPVEIQVTQRVFNECGIGSEWHERSGSVQNGYCT